MTSVSENLKRIEPLVSPYGPVASASSTDSMLRGLHQVTASTTYVGSCWPGFLPPRAATLGGGSAVGDPDRARLTAIAEGAERYSSGDFLGERKILAAASELDGPFVHPDRIPRCSERERAHPRCSWRPLGMADRIRWVQGTDLITGEPTWVPAVLACYRITDLLETEQFSFRISTGHAVHSDPAEALVHAICEVIERDMIALLWLQQLPLPMLAEQNLPDTVQYLLDWSSEHFIRTYLFDATSELGVPTVYCLQVAEHDDRAHQAVGCGSGRSMAEVTGQAILESLRLRPICNRDGGIPDDPADFIDMVDGARYMGRPQLAHAFDFLTDGAEGRTAPHRPDLPADGEQALEQLLATLGRAGMQVVAVNRTPRELADVGLTAVVVVIPDLQPMSPDPLMQFRAHPRLYAAPALMGYNVRAEEDLNPWPQPFA